MRRFLEVFFRHPLAFLALIILLPVMGVGIAYFSYPRTYQAIASIWAFRRYQIISTNGPEADTFSTPAQTQAIVLSELLQSHSFALNVVRGINLAPTLSLDSSVLADPQLTNEALFNEISHQVLVTAQGYNLYTVSYTNRNQEVAQQIVASTIQQFGIVGANFSAIEGQRLLENYKGQLAQAQAIAEKAAAVEEKYLIDHPTLTKPFPLNDPQYSLLDGQRIQAQSTMQGLQKTIATLNEEISTQGRSAEGFYHIVDPPLTGNHPVSRLKYYEVDGGIGLGLAIAGWLLYMLISMRRDRAVYTPLDIQKVSSVPVVMQLPRLSAGTIPLLLEQALPHKT